jgi:hypothetical protein
MNNFPNNNQNLPLNSNLPLNQQQPFVPVGQPSVHQGLFGAHAHQNVVQQPTGLQTGGILSNKNVEIDSHGHAIPSHGLRHELDRAKDRASDLRNVFHSDTH